MIDLYNLDPSDGRVQVFYPRGTITTDAQTWVKPRGVTQVMMLVVGGGGSGGGGLTGATATARGGGSGGGTGGITRVIYPASLVPDLLWVFPGPGGASVGAGAAGNFGSSSTVRSHPTTNSAAHTVCHASGGGAGAAGTTTTNTGGTLGAASTVSSGAWLASGLFVSTAGVAGGAGGSGAGAAQAANVTAFASQVITGGTGGGSTDAANAQAAGGFILTAGLLEAVRNGGTAGGGKGDDGAFSLSPFWSTGGAGGGSSSAGTGGAGGAGGYGSGGGGGGGGITGGAGGRGGDGLVIIACWG